MNKLTMVRLASSAMKGAEAVVTGESTTSQVMVELYSGTSLSVALRITLNRYVPFLDSFRRNE